MKLSYGRKLQVVEELMLTAIVFMELQRIEFWQW